MFFSLHTDASAYGVGGVLNVIRDGEEKPFSKQLQGAEKRYSPTELEGLAIFRAVVHYAHFLYGREFTIATDHKALVQMMTGKALNRGGLSSCRTSRSRWSTARDPRTGMQMAYRGRLGLKMERRWMQPRTVARWSWGDVGAEPSQQQRRWLRPSIT